MQEDTIAAISTPLGEGGIGIIRVSGPEALGTAKKIFQVKGAVLKEPESHQLVYGHVYNNNTGEIIDEALFCYMKAPRSYTREDVVEINCHGSIVSLKKTLELVLSNGARQAEPGEFSKRAFLNGRLDLAQAESVIDLVRTKTETGLKMAMSQLKGDLSREINEIQKDILGFLAQLEVHIDFPDEDHNEEAADELVIACTALLKRVKDLLKGAEAGIIYRNGLRAAIIGRPNVGKSSLLNALLKENRAIVTDIPGTTRDIIEEMINIKGIPLRIIDTAGLHKTEDLVEKIGVERTREVIKKADFVLTVLDGTAELTQQDLDVLNAAGEKKCLIILNKSDLPNKKINVNDLKKLINDRPFVWVSAKHGNGLTELEDLIAKLVFGGNVTSSDDCLITNIRHKKALEKTAQYLSEAIFSIKNLTPLDIMTIDLREAWEALREITGAVYTEDLIDRIFNDFCIGK